MLERRAGKVRDLLLIYIRESGVVEQLHSSLLQAVLEGDDDAATPSIELVKFEVVCFLAVLIMTVEIPRLLPPEIGAVQDFHGAFVRMIHHVVLPFEESEVDSVSFGARMQEYGQLSSSVDAAEHFVKTLALSSGAAGYPLSKIVATRYVEPLVDMSRTSVARVFA